MKIERNEKVPYLTPAVLTQALRKQHGCAQHPVNRILHQGVLDYLRNALVCHHDPHERVALAWDEPVHLDVVLKA